MTEARQAKATALIPDAACEAAVVGAARIGLGSRAADRGARTDTDAFSNDQRQQLAILSWATNS